MLLTLYMHRCIRMYIYKHVYVYMYISVYIHACVYVYMYVCMYAYVCRVVFDDRFCDDDTPRVFFFFHRANYRAPLRNDRDLSQTKEKTQAFFS